MAIWMDEIETDMSPRWRGADIALVSSLAVVVMLQVAVAVYAFGPFGETSLADAAGASVSTPQQSAPISAPEGDGTRFSVAPVNPQFGGNGAEASIAFWFAPQSASAHVDFAKSVEPMIAPTNFTFTSGKLALTLGEVPTDYHYTEFVPAFEGVTQVAQFQPAPDSVSPAKAQEQQMAALRAYLGEDGIIAMGERCGALMDESYKYDGGLVTLCRDVRATL